MRANSSLREKERDGENVNSAKGNVSKEGGWEMCQRVTSRTNDALRA